MAANKLASMDDLLIMELRDLYSAEKQILRALPKMAKAATSKKLQKAFLDHHSVTEKQLERLETVFKELEVSPGRHKCEAMEGLLEEGSEIIKMRGDADPAVLDAALIGAAQRVEHYEIAGYGTARAFAKHLGYERVVSLLEKTLAEEKQTDVQLTELAESEINLEAVEEDQPETTARR